MRPEETKAYREGYDASVRTNSNPKAAPNPYHVGTPDWRAWNLGWNNHYDPVWDSNDGIFQRGATPQREAKC